MEKITLHVIHCAAQPLPINLIQVVGLQNGGRNDTLPRRRAHDKRHGPKEHVQFRLNSRRIAALIHRKLRACIRILDAARGDLPVIVVGALCEVMAVVRSTESGICRAC